MKYNGDKEDFKLIFQWLGNTTVKNVSSRNKRPCSGLVWRIKAASQNPLYPSDSNAPLRETDVVSLRFCGSVGTAVSCADWLVSGLSVYYFFSPSALSLIAAASDPSMPCGGLAPPSGAAHSQPKYTLYSTHATRASLRSASSLLIIVCMRVSLVCCLFAFHSAVLCHRCLLTSFTLTWFSSRNTDLERLEREVHLSLKLLCVPRC